MMIPPCTRSITTTASSGLRDLFGSWCGEVVHAKLLDACSKQRARVPMTSERESISMQSVQVTCHCSCCELADDSTMLSSAIFLLPWWPDVGITGIGRRRHHRIIYLLAQIHLGDSPHLDKNRGRDHLWAQALSLSSRLPQPCRQTCCKEEDLSGLKLRA